jgi:ABC-type antimicrobial peptide transport system permease subunit
MSYLVTRRGREIGIRMALGARMEDVLGLVLRETAWMAGFAVGGGLVGAWAVTRYARSMLYGVTALDGPSFVMAPVVLLAAVLVATVGPAWRACRVDPVAVLREE